MTKLVGEKVRMRIWIGEGDGHGDRPLYEALAELFRREGFAGARRPWRCRGTAP